MVEVEAEAEDDECSEEWKGAFHGVLAADFRGFYGVAVEFIADEAAEFEDHGVGDGVEDGGSGFAAGDDAGIVEEFELFGDVGLAGGEAVDDFGDGEFVRLEFLQDGEAGGFGKGAEQSGYPGELL